MPCVNIKYLRQSEYKNSFKKHSCTYMMAWVFWDHTSCVFWASCVYASVRLTPSLLLEVWWVSIGVKAGIELCIEFLV